MSENRDDIFIADRIGVLPFDAEGEYLAHLLCLAGSCSYRFNGNVRNLQRGDLSIIRKRENIEYVRTIG